MNKYAFYKLYKEWVIDIPFKKKERRFIGSDLTDECVRSLQAGELEVDNLAEESIIKHMGCTFSFYKEFKIK
jgi:hypothetical protein